MNRQLTRGKIFPGALFGALLMSAPLTCIYAEPPTTLASPAMPTPGSAMPMATAPGNPLITPTPPVINAKGYFLMDAYSGKELASSNPDQRMAPASLTKMMTSYIISGALREGRIHMNDLVPISQNAWKTGGSKMFVKVGDQVPVQDLMQGIIVDSGNDACVAMAEFLAGSEDSFVNLMNQQAARLGMKDTHFMDVDGLPNPNHYTTPRDMAILARALVFDFPEDYKWYSQKWFTYNNIKQPNRNRLLWRDSSVDGIKTGHTDEAGFCLVASAQRNDMRLISVVMGAPTDAARADDNEKLLTYGFRFFQSHRLYVADKPLLQARVWQGITKEIPIGLANDVYVTVPTGQATQTKANVNLNAPLKAPIKKGEVVGTVSITLNNTEIAKTNLIALQEDALGGFWRRLIDKIVMYFHGT
jgi:D-alanyl-D-alanine carboxypeptidase (penicillin-binding protein 5/6)